ncbi:MAG: antibiotic biosynthesis monooxygenase [Deltaproteobacteria bacterium]|nr:antibiotic biosynthesis monooxygenase [Deltaproteobacteria bacterium]
MYVCVLIERKFKGSPYPEHLQAISNFRIGAMQQRGYIRGETLVNRENPQEVVVLSVWSSLEDWEKWLRCDERRKLEDEMAPYVEGPAKIRVFTMGADYVKESYSAAAGGE